MSWTERKYRLVYDGNGAHEVWRENRREFQLKNAERLFKSPSFNEKALAEALLSSVEYQDHLTARWDAQKSLPLNMEKVHSREIDHVHAACSDEIESKWNKPVMTEEEVLDALYFDAVSEHLADIEKEIEIDLGGGKSKAPNA